MRALRLVLAAVLMVAVSASAFAQGSFLTSLSGTVVDTSGGVIPGADVKVKNNGTGAENVTVTAINGTFSIPSLPGGIYSVTVSLQGFKTVTLSTVTLNAAIPASVKVVMSVGAIEENVTVVGDSGLVVQTQTPSVATTMSATQIISLPLTSRNAIDSLTSLPGFNTSGTARDSTISGLPKSSINITLDGMSIQDNYLKTSDGFFARLQPGADAVEEVTVTTAANTADVSGQGGAQIKFVTRSGSNTLSGSVYEYYRNDIFNANTWFNNRDLPPDPETGKAPKAALRQHTPGFRVGGPIIPDKAFFFVNYEQFRRPSNLTQNRIVLTPAAQSGIFAYTANGVTRQVNLLQLAAAAGVPNTIGSDGQQGPERRSLRDGNSGVAHGSRQSGGAAVQLPGSDNEPQHLPGGPDRLQRVPESSDHGIVQLQPHQLDARHHEHAAGELSGLHRHRQPAVDALDDVRGAALDHRQQHGQ